jgi:serine protease inhibitor
VRRAAIIAVLLLGCKAPREAPSRPAPAAVDAPFVAEEEAPAVAPPRPVAPAADVRALAQGVDAFAWSLFATQRAYAGNRVVSPAAVAVTLAMTASLDRGAAAEQVRATLAPGLDAARLHDAAGALVRAWQSPLAGTSGALAVQRIFVSQGVRFDDAVNARLREVYGAPAGVVDTGGPEGARRRIDGFIAARTRGAIAATVPEHAVVADAPAIAASGALLRFVCEGDVSSVRFRVGGLGPTDARSALCRGGVRSARGDGFTLLRVPSRDERYTLDVVLPDEGARLADFERTFARRSYDAAVTALQPDASAVNLPALRVAHGSPEGLRGALVSIGLDALFDPDRCDLARPSLRGGWVSELFHRARFELDAATERAPDGETAVRSVDRPFVFVLRDASRAVVLAIGHVVEP